MHSTYSNGSHFTQIALLSANGARTTSSFIRIPAKELVIEPINDNWHL
jgi:hypothetical protein